MNLPVPHPEKAMKATAHGQPDSVATDATPIPATTQTAPYGAAHPLPKFLRQQTIHPQSPPMS